MKVCFVASPLTARSGVYRSARELVSAGRRAGHDWHLFLGVSERAAGVPLAAEPWVRELVAEPDGVRGIRDLARTIRQDPVVRDSDIVVSLLPQTDMALAGLPVPWVAYLRGLPWPDAGESSVARRIAWRALERRALSRAREVWATTNVLRRHAKYSEATIVPAGVEAVPRSWHGDGARTKVVWAARFDHDKRPGFFLDVMRDTELDGVMYGSGPLLTAVSASAPQNVTVGGWVDPDHLWNDALAYAGTSAREAFGRSAVEAAMNGVPVVLNREFGSAEALIQDAEFARLFVLGDDPHDWRAALDLLRKDEALRRAYSDHLRSTSAELTIEKSAAATHRALVGLLSTSARRNKSPWDEATT